MHMPWLTLLLRMCCSCDATSLMNTLSLSACSLVCRATYKHSGQCPEHSPASFWHNTIMCVNQLEGSMVCNT
ncbi:hypothetical protein V8C86DRAFT_2463255 [Haematococcus lacustris]